MAAVLVAPTFQVQTTMSSDNLEATVAVRLALHRNPGVPGMWLVVTAAGASAAPTSP